MERASQDDGIYEVTGWEPRSRMDRLAVGIHSLLVQAGKWGVFLAGLFLTAAIATFTALDLVLEPFIAALVVLSVVPALLLAAYVHYADVTTGEPLGVVSVTFLLAVVTASFAALLNDLGGLVVGAVTAPLGQVIGLLALYFLVVGPVEESVKLLAVRLYAYNHERFDAVIDGAVYGAVAGLGFATIENALYITGVIEDVGGVAAATFGDYQEITAARALAGPGHVLYSAIAGYYLGLAKFNRERWGQIVTKGILVAALFHGFYNATVGVGAGLIAFFTPLPPLAAVLVYIVGYLLVVGSYLYRKLDRYRRAYRDHGAGGGGAGGGDTGGRGAGGFGGGDDSGGRDDASRVTTGADGENSDPIDPYGRK